MMFHSQLNITTAPHFIPPHSLAASRCPRGATNVLLTLVPNGEEVAHADPPGGFLLPRGSSSPHEHPLIVLLSDGFSRSDGFLKVCCDCAALKCCRRSGCFAPGAPEDSYLCIKETFHENTYRADAICMQDVWRSKT